MKATSVIQIYETTKFHHADSQFIIVGWDLILLRVVCWHGGGVIMTATAGDDRGPHVYPRPRALVNALGQALDDLGGQGAAMQIDHDRHHRVFGAVVDKGSLDSFLDAAFYLAQQMADLLGLGAGPRSYPQ